MGARAWQAGRARRARPALQGAFRTLNRLTAPQLVRAVEAAGFGIIRDYYTRNAPPVPAALAEPYTEAALTTDQIVILARRAPAAR